MCNSLNAVVKMYFNFFSLFQDNGTSNNSKSNKTYSNGAYANTDNKNVIQLYIYIHTYIYTFHIFFRLLKYRFIKLE